MVTARSLRRSFTVLSPCHHRTVAEREKDHAFTPNCTPYLHAYAALRTTPNPAVALACCLPLNADSRRSNRVGFAADCKFSTPPPGSPNQSVQVYLRVEAFCMHVNRLCSTTYSETYEVGEKTAPAVIVLQVGISTFCSASCEIFKS